ncbi:hypothetical protein C4C32_03935 [Pseudomonas corrugata]|uniref:Uncharacterized protein n=1 Tax=Pseudomonas corrugata TaxID=47879 RepID=A0A8B6UT41_9PSED|nr:hypothetical protein [Pseudomonas corrugata]QTH15068.1 hypothetical protein C4C32_03935 [Pseudomonas corrugata]
MTTLVSSDLAPALASDASVKEFSEVILHLSMAFQEALRRLAGQDEAFPSEGYGMLTEAYGLRTRANILYLTPSTHVVQRLNFSQTAMLGKLEEVLNCLDVITDLHTINSILVSVITIASALGEGRAKVVEFLFETLCTDLESWKD